MKKEKNILSKQKPWNKFEVYFFTLTFVLPMYVAMVWAYFGVQSFQIYNWKILLQGSLFFSLLYLIGNGFLLYMLVKRRALSKLGTKKRIQILFAPIFFPVIFLYIFEPLNSFRDLRVGLKEFKGSCVITSEVSQQYYFDNPRHFILIEDYGVDYKLRINRYLYNKLKGNTSSGLVDTLIGYDGPCGKIANIYFLKYSKIAFPNKRQ